MRFTAAIGLIFDTLRHDGDRICRVVDAYGEPALQGALMTCTLSPVSDVND
jgi:hypothetical protein